MNNSHWQFLEDELIAETQEFEKVFTSRAIRLLLEEEKMYVGQFIGFKNGQMLIKFPNTRSIPRKREYLYCMLLPAELRQYKNWGNRTYEDLYGQRFKGSDAVCVWHSVSDDSRCSLVGFNDIELEFAEQVKDAIGILLVFAPKRPPIEYLANLQKIIEEPNDDICSIIHQKNTWNPVLIQEESTDEYISDKMQKSNTVILQGPPGTGKTYLIAQLCRKFIEDGKSVLVTALTNRALMEVAEKKALFDLLNQGKVCKTNVTASELNEIPTLCPIVDIEPQSGKIMMATYYKSSAYARDIQPESKFDIVIMDEASQAFTAMFAASIKMGKRQLWVGDTHQLPPIVLMNKDRILEKNYSTFIEGMRFVADHLNEPVYQLTSTWRFGHRATQFTGIFYSGTLTTKVNQQQFNIPQKLVAYLNPLGGPVYIPKSMAVGDLRPMAAIEFAISIVKEYLSIDPNKPIAILSHQVRTSNAIQQALIYNGIDSPNIIAETVARVQGLTTDIVIYLVVNSSYMFSLNPNLFNVATSRAREHTIIIADENIILNATSPKVFKFLSHL